jgi:hypothetical protein
MTTRKTTGRELPFFLVFFVSVLFRHLSSSHKQWLQRVPAAKEF